MDYPVDLSSEIQLTLNDFESSKIKMKDLTGNCEWDTMYILTPYNDVDGFLSENNITWNGDIALSSSIPSSFLFLHLEMKFLAMQK